MRLAGAAAGIREAVGAVAEPWSRRLVEQWLGRTRERLGVSGDRAWDEGKELTDHEAIALALDER